MARIERFLSSRPTSELMNYQLYGAKTPAVATGGNNISISGGYAIHTFSTTGTSIFSIVSGINSVDYLIVAGGASGGSYVGGGGGAGAGSTIVLVKFTPL